MAPLDLKTYCPQHSVMTKQIGDLLIETQAQTMTLRDSSNKLEAIKHAVDKHQVVHDTEEKIKARGKWIYPLLLTLALALIGAAAKVGSMMAADPKEIAAAVVAAQKGQP
jgi:hypothetical protein